MMGPHIATALDADTNHDLRDEVWRGLSAIPKTLPCRFFYDARGSALFEAITELPEYYPTRTEIALLKDHGEAIAHSVAPGAAVIEFGSGSGRKTELLLANLRNPQAYVPIEISAAALFPATRRLQSRFPALRIKPILGGFDDLSGLRLPKGLGATLGFFPGSTIGNMTRAQAIGFLRSARAFLGTQTQFLIGVDLKKPRDILLAAYNDAAGVTAAFNLNLLARINRELSARIDVNAFAHEAIYNAQHGRIEMHLRALRPQRLKICGRVFCLAEGETIHTENSHKYTCEEFQTLARAGGWRVSNTWVDEHALFSLHLLS